MTDRGTGDGDEGAQNDVRITMKEKNEGRQLVA
jgi:hypothetical protein